MEFNFKLLVAINVIIGIVSFIGLVLSSIVHLSERFINQKHDHPDHSSLESQVQTLQDWKESFPPSLLNQNPENDLTDHVQVTTSYVEGCIDGTNYQNQPCIPELVFSTQGTARWKITKDGHIMPINSSSYDIGKPEKKVRYVFETDT